MGQHPSNQDKPSDSEIDQLVMNEYLYPIAVNYRRILEVNNGPAHTDGVVLNPGALHIYSYALHDAVESVALPVVEVHLSDIASREEWRAHSVVSPACAATIGGHGADGYREALEFLARRLQSPAR